VTAGQYGSGLNSGWVYRDRIKRERGGGEEVLEFYTRRYTHSSRDEWRRRIESGLIRLDLEVVSAGAVLAAGQELTYHRPPWREPVVPRDFEILYEDGEITAIDKPAGLPVLPGADYLENTLLWMVRRHYGDSDVFAPVHRLGRGTSGAILFATGASARRGLSIDLQQGRMHKRYRALVQGVPRQDEFTVTESIGRLPHPLLRYVYGVCADGKPSRSEVQVLERRPDRCEQAAASGGRSAEFGCALVQVDIPTGRPHQIRIHLAAAGFPLVGDRLYLKGGGLAAPSGGERAPLPGDVGYHLHSTRVSFHHPSTHETVVVYCRPPEILRRREETVS
jgi:23S rRNA pseudouridine1911/1915/1917 synthase